MPRYWAAAQGSPKLSPQVRKGFEYLTQIIYLEGINFLATSTSTKDFVAIQLTTGRVERVSLEDCSY